MKLMLLQDQYAIVKLNQDRPIPEWAFAEGEKELLSITYTKEELSIVCAEANVPQTGLDHVEKPWKCLKIQGSLDFSLTGILSSLTRPLADAGISIFAVSTYDTDYVLIKEHNIGQAIQVLIKEGHEIT